MNLYLVVSEPLSEVVWEDWFNQVGHEEEHAIAELVVAQNRGQAKWLAWATDTGNTFNKLCPDVRDMPKFRIRLRRKSILGPARIVSGEEGFQDDSLWEA